MRLVAAFLSLISLAAWQARDPAAAVILPTQEIRDGWLLLFDGESTFGWMIEGDARVENGDLVLGGDRETTARSTTAFGDFNLAFQYRQPADTDQVPKGVNYDLWLGPAPKRAFNPYRFHHDFRWWWDYGNGLCNDWGVHLNDIVLWAMKAQAPVAVTAQGGKFDVKDISDTPDTLDVYFEYPTFVHAYTVRRGRTHGGFGGRNHGMEFQGTQATLTLDRGGWIVTDRPGSQNVLEKHGGSEQHFAHVQNFLSCIRNRSQKTNSDIEDMHRATTTCHLANISYKLQRKIYWDAEAERCYRGFDAKERKPVIEDAQANALLFREPRPGWKLSL